VLLVEFAFKMGSDRELNHSFLHRHFSTNLSTPSTSALVQSLFSPQSSSLVMAASHPHLFQPSIADKNEIRDLVTSYFFLDREVLQ
jgi:hypothetical protein